MANNYPFNTNNQMQMQYFLQPQGNIYMLSSSNEASIVPIGNGLSAGICLNEGTLYLKTMQNGAPMMLTYKISPLDGTSTVTKTAPTTSQYEELNARISKIEEAMQAKGGKLEWQTT